MASEGALGPTPRPCTRSLQRTRRSRRLHLSSCRLLPAVRSSACGCHRQQADAAALQKHPCSISCRTPVLLPRQLTGATMMLLWCPQRWSSPICPVIAPTAFGSSLTTQLADLIRARRPNPCTCASLLRPTRRMVSPHGSARPLLPSPATKCRGLHYGRLPEELSLFSCYCSAVAAPPHAAAARALVGDLKGGNIKELRRCRWTARTNYAMARGWLSAVLTIGGMQPSV